MSLKKKASGQAASQSRPRIADELLAFPALKNRATVPPHTRPAPLLAQDWCAQAAAVATLSELVASKRLLLRNLPHPAPDGRRSPPPGRTARAAMQMHLSPVPRSSAQGKQGRVRAPAVPRTHFVLLLPHSLSFPPFARWHAPSPRHCAPPLAGRMSSLRRRGLSRKRRRARAEEEKEREREKEREAHEQVACFPSNVASKSLPRSPLRSRPSSPPLRSLFALSPPPAAPVAMRGVGLAALTSGGYMLYQLSRPVRSRRRQRQADQPAGCSFLDATNTLCARRLLLRPARRLFPHGSSPRPRPPWLPERTPPHPPCRLSAPSMWSALRSRR